MELMIDLIISLFLFGIPSLVGIGYWIKTCWFSPISRAVALMIKEDPDGWEIGDGYYWDAIHKLSRLHVSFRSIHNNSGISAKINNRSIDNGEARRLYRRLKKLRGKLIIDRYKSKAQELKEEKEEFRKQQVEDNIRKVLNDDVM